MLDEDDLSKVLKLHKTDFAQFHVSGVGSSGVRAQKIVRGCKSQ